MTELFLLVVGVAAIGMLAVLVYMAGLGLNWIYKTFIKRIKRC